MKGLKTISSNYPVKETIERLVSIAQTLGLTLFARIDHSANALKSGLQLRPTELIILGNPKAGTLLMQDNQTAGIDLPIKALAWEDESGKVWLTYNEAAWLKERHSLKDSSNATLDAIEKGMARIAKESAQGNQ